MLEEQASATICDLQRQTKQMCLMCLTRSPNEHAGDSLDADGNVFELHTSGLFIHHSKQEVKVD